MLGNLKNCFYLVGFMDKGRFSYPQKKRQNRLFFYNYLEGCLGLGFPASIQKI